MALSALVVIGYPYASSRMAVYAKKAITTMHCGDAEKARAEKQDSEAWGRLARYLNGGAYAVLVLALWYLGAFFCWNLP